jgi:hypothetical protein
MVGLVPTIHVFAGQKAVFKTWMLGTRPSMTACSTMDARKLDPAQEHSTPDLLSVLVLVRRSRAGLDLIPPLGGVFLRATRLPRRLLGGALALAQALEDKSEPPGTLTLGHVISRMC